MGAGRAAFFRLAAACVLPAPRVGVHAFPAAPPGAACARRELRGVPRLFLNVPRAFANGPRLSHGRRHRAFPRGLPSFRRAPACVRPGSPVALRGFPGALLGAAFFRLAAPVALRGARGAPRLFRARSRCRAWRGSLRERRARFLRESRWAGLMFLTEGLPEFLERRSLGLKAVRIGRERTLIVQRCFSFFLRKCFNGISLYHAWGGDVNETFVQGSGGAA